MALFKSGKYLEAFKVFEKVSFGMCSNNPKLWYYMGLCSLNLNKQLYEENNTSQSDLYHQKIGYSLPHYVRQSQNQKHKRFELVPKGDQVSVMENLMMDFETNKLEDSKKAYLDAHKKFNQEQLQGITKTALKKYEKTTIQAWAHINSSSGNSLQLESAIMYMQNALSQVESQIKNEVRYSINFKQVASQQITQMEYTQLIFQDEVK